MAEEMIPATAETISEQVSSPAVDMELEIIERAEDLREEGGDSGEKEPVTNGNADSKRVRDDDEDEETDEVTKKQKMEKSVEEARLGNLEGGSEEGDKEKCDKVSLGPKSFESAVEMFDYFYKFLHYWPPNLNVNKYEQMVILDLIKKGHPEPEKKIMGGISSFQIRYHPTWKSRCFFLIREDASTDDFSFRKCVDHILPLPEDMKIKPDANKALGGSNKHRGGRSGGGGRRGRGRGNWGKSRN